MHKIIPLLVAAIVSPLLRQNGFSFEEINPIFSEIHEVGPIHYYDPSANTPSYFSFSDLLIPSTSTSETSSQSSSSISSSSNIDDSSDYFYCDRYGPFSINNPQNFQASFTYELRSISSQNIIERIRLFSNGNVVSASSKPSKYYESGQRNETEFTINIKDYWASIGLEIRFEILNSSTRTILKAYSAYFLPPKEQTIPISTLKSQIYVSNSLGFYGNGKTMKEVIEFLDFRKIGDYVDNDYYYRLDLTKNTFIYPNDYILSYKSAYLRFDDSEMIFPHVTHQSNGEIIIPLNLYRFSDDSVGFQYKNSFYVNKRTLDISDTYRSNYVYTRDFYLPINGLKKFNGKTLYIELNGVGLDGISTTVPLKYQLNRTIVGTCSDGEYCVIGGSRK